MEQEVVERNENIQLHEVTTQNDQNTTELEQEVESQKEFNFIKFLKISLLREVILTFLLNSTQIISTGFIFDKNLKLVYTVKIGLFTTITAITIIKAYLIIYNKQLVHLSICISQLIIFLLFFFIFFDFSIFNLIFAKNSLNLLYYFFFLHMVFIGIIFNTKFFKKYFLILFFSLLLVFIVSGLLLSVFLERSITIIISFVCTILYSISAVSLLGIKKNFYFFLEVIYYVLFIFLVDNAINSAFFQKEVVVDFDILFEFN